MRSRLVLVAAATLVIGTLGTAPAEAAPADPTLENVATTAGELTADVLVADDAPFVLATITGDFGQSHPSPVTEGKASLVFDTSGFNPGAVLKVAACETDAYAVATCSSTVQQGFTPVDAAITVTWPEDTSVGPGQTFGVEVADTGSGDLVARWSNDVSGMLSTPLAHNGTTDIATQDGTGLVYIERCNGDAPTFCRGIMDNGSLVTSPLTVRTKSTFALAAVPTISQVDETASPSIQTPLRGDYVLDYQFEKVGGGTVAGETDVMGTVPSNGTIANVIEVNDLDSALSDGEWDLVVDLTNDDPAFDDEPLPTTEVKARFTVDATGPAATITGNRGTIHPRISGMTSYPNSVTATATGDTSGIADWVVRPPTAAEGVFARTFPTGTSVTWNGKNDFGEVVGPGTYQIHTRDALGNLSASFASVVVTSKHVVSGSFSREVKAGPTVVDRYVGRCSTLRRPSLRGWVGSLGFYANTRCANTAVRPSLVSTVHGITVPAGFNYTYLRISAYAGASRQRGRSQAVLRYLTDTGKWRLEYLMHPTLGWQNAAAPAAPNAYIDKNNRLYWGVYTLSGHRYDVAKFKIQLKYQRVVD